MGRSWSTARRENLDLSYHKMMSDPAKLITDDRVIPSFLGYDSQGVIVTWNHLDIDVSGLKAEPMIEIQGT